VGVQRDEERREVVLDPSPQGHVAAVPAVYYDNTLPFSHALQPGRQPPESLAHSSAEFYPGVWQAGSRSSPAFPVRGHRDKEEYA